MNVDSSVNRSEPGHRVHHAGGRHAGAAASQASPAQEQPADALDRRQRTARAGLTNAVTRGDLTATRAPDDQDRYSIRVLNPGLTDHVKGHAHYGEVEGQLFDKQPGSAMFQDPDQGRMGDCYFVQAMSSIAYKHPGFIKHAMHRNDDGTVTVRLFTKDPGADTMHPVDVTVGPELPLANATGNPVYTTSADPNELWPCYMEKAFAALRQFETQQPGYNAIGNKGTAAEAFAALTGLPSELAFKFTRDKPQPGEVYKELKQAFDDGKYVSAGTPENAAEGFVSDHAYTVLGVHSEGGHDYVTLRNPWGHHEPGNDGTDDGIFTITMKQFIDDYAGVTVT